MLVYLPPDYDPATADRYPVLYLHDGQNVFDQATSFGDEWRVDETAQELITAGRIEPIIVVGIYNTGEHRVDEYTPTPSADGKTGGHADDYGRMLVEELKPFIDATYKTLPGAANTADGRIVARRPAHDAPRSALSYGVRKTRGAVAVGVVGRPRDPARSRGAPGQTAAAHLARRGDA